MTARTENGLRRPTKYEQLANILEQRVRSRAPNDLLETERELLEEFGVSRATVRQALQLLIRKGLVYNVQGSGTYVADPEMVTKTLRLTGFSEDMRQRGLEPASCVLSQGRTAAPSEVAAKLEIPPGEPLLRIRRLRLADDVPMALEDVFLVAALVDVEELDYRRSLYEQLREQGVKAARAAQTIDAVNLGAEEARHLDQAVGSAALRVRRVTFTGRGQPFELAETLYRGDRYSFDIMVEVAE